MSRSFKIPVMIVVLFGLYLSLSCTQVKPISLTPDTSSSFYPFTLGDITATCVDTIYRIVGVYNVYPPAYIEKIDSLVYQVNFSLIFTNPEWSWDRPFYLILELPGGATEEIIFNEEGEVLDIRHSLRYSFLLKVKQPGVMRMTLGFEGEQGEILYDRDNPFQSKKVKLDDHRQL